MAPYSFDAYQGRLYRVFEGTILEGVVTNHIDGGFSGPIMVSLTTDLYSHDHQQLLLPQGTRLLGDVQSVGNAQQRKMFVTFHRAICPDGFSLEFAKYIGLDQIGTTGLATKVNHGYLQAFAAAAAIGGLGGLAQIGNNGSILDPSTEIRNGISEQSAVEGEQVLNHFLNRLPIITLKEGSRARVYINFSLAHRPIVNRYIRIDEMGRAQAIQYSDLDYTPREGEVRTYLTDWANYRYTINRDTIASKYPLNYYFLSQSLASQLMADDNQNHLVSQVMAGQIEQSDVEVRDVTITSMSVQTIQRAKVARGTALVAIDRIYSPDHSHQPRTEHWMLSVTYYLNPAQVSQQAQIFPQFETINPLGLTITEFHENRVSVVPIAPGTPAPAATGIATPTTGAER